MNKVYYFTNPTDDRHRSREVQLRIESETGLKLVNPFYDIAGVASKEIKALDRGDFSPISCGEIIHNDLKLVRDCGGVIAFITNKTSWGSIDEVFYSGFEKGFPTYLIFDPDTRDPAVCPCHGIKNPNNPSHPWPKGTVTKIFGTVEGFINFAKEKLCA